MINIGKPQTIFSGRSIIPSLSITRTYKIHIIVRCIDRVAKVYRFAPFFGSTIVNRLVNIITTHAFMTFATEIQCFAIIINKRSIFIEGCIDYIANINSRAPFATTIFYRVKYVETPSRSRSVA